MVVTNLVNGCSFTSNDVGVVLGINTEGDGKATKLLEICVCASVCIYMCESRIFLSLQIRTPPCVNKFHKVLAEMLVPQHNATIYMYESRQPLQIAQRYCSQKPPPPSPPKLISMACTRR